MNRFALLASFLVVGCTNEIIATHTVVEGGDTGAEDTGFVEEDTGDVVEQEPAVWALVVSNMSEFDLDYIEACFDPDRLDCVVVGP